LKEREETEIENLPIAVIESTRKLHVFRVNVKLAYAFLSAVAAGVGALFLCLLFPDPLEAFAGLFIVLFLALYRIDLVLGVLGKVMAPLSRMLRNAIAKYWVPHFAVYTAVLVILNIHCI